MKPLLMYKDQDFNINQKLPWSAQHLIQDLELETLFQAMGHEDEFLINVAKQSILGSLGNEPETITYRQNILQDCLNHPSVVREVYQIPLEVIENKKRRWYGTFLNYPGARLSGAIAMMRMFSGLLKKLKNIADRYMHKFESEGMRRFFTMLQTELDDDYLAAIQNHLQELSFPNGVLISAELGEGNAGHRYILHKPNKKKSLMDRILPKKTHSPVYTYSLHPRDNGGRRALSALRDKGITRVANVLSRSAAHIDSFFNALRIELGFYIGCLNLHEQLSELGQPMSFPFPAAYGERTFSANGLYDVCLALTRQQQVVGNQVNADRRDLVIITGANQGGKSTFLRSVGLAQLMMQCGMFVPAKSFGAGLCDALFTHFKREEDISMQSGKLDEELGRMSDIVDHLKPHSMILFNESFAATNEREGSEIARQIIIALIKKGIRVFFVTHLYNFPRLLYDNGMENVMFLRAERQAGGKRTFQMIQGEPVQTSHGEDLYFQIFETAHHRSTGRNLVIDSSSRQAKPVTE